MKKKITEKTIASFRVNWNLVEFYENVAREFDFSLVEERGFDCRKILVSESIIQKWYEWFEEEHGKGKAYELSVLLLLTGPKAGKELEDGEVFIAEGFLTTKGGE